MSRKSGTRNPRTTTNTGKAKNKSKKTEEVKEETTIDGAVNEPGSGRHEAPAVHGGEQTNEWPRG